MSKGMMGEIKTTHRGGDSASKPGVRPNPGHPEQRPGAAANGVKLGKMSWSGKEQK